MNKAKTIAISGPNGIGKSTFSTFLAKNVEKSNNKTLLIDFDLEENHIRTILKIKKQQMYNGNINDLIIKINERIDVLCFLDMVFNENDIVNYLKVQEILNSLKDKYDFIIVDTSAILNKEYTKRIFYNSDIVVFLMEPNILGIKKAKNMLEILENDWKVSASKIKIILNKSNIYEISKQIVEEIFPNNQIIGKMQYRDSYNLMINKNINKKEIKDEYERIYKKINNVI